VVLLSHTPFAHSSYQRRKLAAQKEKRKRKRETPVAKDQAKEQLVKPSKASHSKKKAKPSSP